MLAELLLAEKDATRVWLRAEMDRRVDPMLNSIFDRLQTKLTNGLERTQSGDGGEVLNQSYQFEPSHVQMHQLSFVIGQPSTSNIKHQNVHHSYQLPNGPINFNENFNQHSELRPFDSIPLIRPNVQVNSVQLFNEPTDQAHSPQSLYPTISNVQSNHNLNDRKLNDEDDEICECDECVNGIEIDDQVEDDDDDSESVQWIEDEQEEIPVKRPRLDSTQPNNATQPEVVRMSPRQLIEEEQPNQVNNQDKQIITIRLQCSEPECPETFTTDGSNQAEDQLTQHAWNAHSIRLFQCQVKDCDQSFDNCVFLGAHIKSAHTNTTQWHCDKCDRHFTSYKYLSHHTTENHQLGHFQCSFPSCTFTGEYRRKMFNHYTQKHKSNPDFVCPLSGCHYRTNNSTRFKGHKRAHLGIKPYRCKWPDCVYSSVSQNNTMRHIKTHFNQRTNASNVVLLDKSSDYLEVVHDLL